MQLFFMWHKQFYKYNSVIMPHVSTYKIVFFNIITLFCHSVVKHILTMTLSSMF